MAEIASYICSNLKCRFAMRVSREMPLWKPGTPRALQSLSVRPEAQSFVLKYRSELFCHVCRTVVEHQDTKSCNACGAIDLRDEQVGKPCAQCPIGVFEMKKLIVY